MKGIRFAINAEDLTVPARTLGPSQCLMLERWQRITGEQVTLLLPLVRLPKVFIPQPDDRILFRQRLGIARKLGYTPYQQRYGHYNTASLGCRVREASWVVFQPRVPRYLGHKISKGIGSP